MLEAIKFHQGCIEVCSVRRFHRIRLRNITRQRVLISRSRKTVTRIAIILSVSSYRHPSNQNHKNRKSQRKSSSQWSVDYLWHANVENDTRGNLVALTLPPASVKTRRQNEGNEDMPQWTPVLRVLRTYHASLPVISLRLML